eukprot:TRINITY_DN19922_c0_g1_i2.p1 TRINITY_DN19922_c0_g1~~TRINITY_DN19922_c0_g1_i2.p1  ORF type:complete len:172 (+),score=43.20 TRINITY_DN19922_c0_g1_i2:78-593(+)
MNSSSCLTFSLPILSYFFFFQAEDGIRDAQESRGLGDVYKRQVSTQSTGIVVRPMPAAHLRKSAVSGLFLPGALSEPRVWVQGVIVSVNTEKQLMQLDDGSGTVLVYCKAILRMRDCQLSSSVGNYVMIVGELKDGDTRRWLWAHQLVDLTNSPDRETLWDLELATQGAAH